MNQTAEKLPEVVKENNIVSMDQSPLAAAEKLLLAGVDLDKIEKMLELQEKFDAMAAKKAFTQAMAAFKEDPPCITKDKTNNQYKSKYTSLGNLINSSLPKMSAHGLSHKWNVIQQGEGITVDCIVTHREGHSETVRMTAPPDGSGSKNPIQQIKSTITYLKAATFESAMGLAATDANFDDDGNNATAVKYISEKQVSIITDMINEWVKDERDFLKWVGVESVEQIPADQYGRVKSALEGLRQ